MGFEIKFNWALQIEIDHPLEIGCTYGFEKNNYRVYPVDVPIDLINSNREAMAKIRVVEFLNKGNKTVGKYEVIKIYSSPEREILTNYWKENQ